MNSEAEAGQMPTLPEEDDWPRCPLDEVLLEELPLALELDEVDLEKKEPLVPDELLRVEVATPDVLLPRLVDEPVPNEPFVPATVPLVVAVEAGPVELMPDGPGLGARKHPNPHTATKATSPSVGNGVALPASRITASSLSMTPAIRSEP